MVSAALKLLGRRLWSCRCGNRCAATPTACSSFLFRCAAGFPPRSFRYNYSSYSLSSCEVLHDSSISVEEPPPPADAAEVFRRWGCTDAEVTSLLDRHPFIRRMNLNNLAAKIQLLGGLGVIGSSLVRLVDSRPRILNRRLAADVENRLDLLRTLFASGDDLLRAIVRNPSLLIYDMERKVGPCVRLYGSVGVSALDVGRLILCRPTTITRCSLEDGKLELLRRIPIGREATMYKYAVGVLATSNLETLQTKIANLEKFGIGSDEVMELFSRNPNVLTLSTEKIQRNMTYIMGTIKLPSAVIVRYPHLVICNVDKVLRPRYLLGLKLEEMGLQPQMKMKEPALLVRVLKMSEERFLEVFVVCHPKDVVEKLMEYYSSCMGVRRLAESSRKSRKKTFLY